MGAGEALGVKHSLDISFFLKQKDIACLYGEGKESEILKNKEADGGRGDEKAGEAGGLGSSSEAAGRRGELGRRWKKASGGEGRRQTMS